MESTCSLNFALRPIHLIMWTTHTHELRSVLESRMTRWPPLVHYLCWVASPQSQSPCSWSWSWSIVHPGLDPAWECSIYGEFFPPMPYLNLACLNHLGTLFHAWHSCQNPFQLSPVGQGFIGTLWGAQFKIDALTGTSWIPICAFWFGWFTVVTCGLMAGDAGGMYAKERKEFLELAIVH